VPPTWRLPTSTRSGRRLQLLDWAQSSRSWIVEDDYDSEFRFDRHPRPSLQCLDRTSRVIYIGTFSKVLFPSLRIGYVVIPTALVDSFVSIRHSMDVSPPHLTQAVLADFINEGHFSRHLRRMRIAHGERRRTLVDCLREEIGVILEVHVAEAGLHVAVTQPRGYRDRSIAARAAQQNLLLWPLSPTYLGPASREGFILGLVGITIAEILPAVRRLREVL